MYFNKILIANRGEIAVRLIRACHELGIAAVAVYSAADRAALHVRLADEAYPIGEAPAVQSYLHVERLVDAALRSGAQAVHPGYGFLSERAQFARACQAAGLVFIGPPADAIELMGSKIAAKRLAEQAGVPTVPGYMGSDQQIERLFAAAEQVGYPLLIKASAGGGGKGMRVVARSSDFADAVEAARREAQAAFGDDAVFLERLIERPRHIEFQILADAHGACVHLFERECSIQRRHQKIIEESPSPALPPALRAEMGAAAVRLALAANYCNAGTIEFMLDQAGNFFFLEMNTRLQVEHPVTEAVAGVDLVHLQIAIAAGEQLPFGQADLGQRGHAIEARVYAEDPRTFLPSTGRVALFAPPSGPGIRNDAGLASGDEVSVHYDPMLAKLIVAAPNRTIAIERLRCALHDYAVLGVTTNLPLLRAIAEHPEFAAGNTPTDFLSATGLTERNLEDQPLPVEVLIAAAMADLLSPSACATNRAADPWQAGPWRLGGGVRVRFLHNQQEQLVILDRRGEHWQAQAGSYSGIVALVARSADQLVVELDRRIERFGMVREGGDWLIAWCGASFRLARVSGLSVDALGGAAAAHGQAGLAAPMPGTLMKVLVQPGQQVEAQQPLLILEAMKMEHVVAAPYSGIVRKLFFEAGALVAKGAVLIELDDPK